MICRRGLPKVFFRVTNGRYFDVGSLQEIEEAALCATFDRFGALVENLPIRAETRDFELGHGCERVTLPLELLNDIHTSGCAPHPKNIFIFVFYEFGVLPPISRLTSEQAMLYFLSGPQSSCQPCFAPTGLPLRLKVYAELFRQRLQKVKPHCWLINVGCIGAGGYRKFIAPGTTRRAIQSALKGTLNGVPGRLSPVFRLEVPTECPSLLPDELDPATHWSDTESYVIRAETLAEHLKRQFERFDIDESVRVAALS